MAEPRLSGLQLQSKSRAGEVSCGLEPECCGHHRKEMTGREDAIEPTELVIDRMWREGGRTPCNRAATCVVGRKWNMNRTPNQGFSVNSVSPLKAGMGLTAP